MSGSKTEEKEVYPQFARFGELPDSAQHHVLSFLATAPKERIFDGENFSDERGSLTRTLPFVCTKFREFCQSERLWELCLDRALRTDQVWSAALGRMTPNLETPQGLVPALRQHYNLSSCQTLYKMILDEHIRIKLPIFFMPMQFDTDTPHPRYQLHFFEPRYRLMMAELMRGHDHQPGENGPVFLHVIDMRGPASKVAALVRVVECVFATDGRCVAELEVVGSVRLRRCWVRPQSYSLYYGDGYRCDGLPLIQPLPQQWTYRVFN